MTADAWHCTHSKHIHGIAGPTGCGALGIWAFHCSRTARRARREGARACAKACPLSAAASTPDASSRKKKSPQTPPLRAVSRRCELAKQSSCTGFAWSHTFVHACVRERERESMRVCIMHVCMYECIEVCMNVCMCACMYVCMYVCVYVGRMHACMYTCAHTYDLDVVQWLRCGFLVYAMYGCMCLYTLVYA